MFYLWYSPFVCTADTEEVGVRVSSRDLRFTTVVVVEGEMGMVGGGRVEGLLGDEALLHPLLLLHPPVLEPDLHLGLVELEGRGDLYPPRPGQVLVEVELLLEFGELFVGEVGPPRVVQEGVGWVDETPGASSDGRTALESSAVAPETTVLNAC